ncbi:hypothetical protein [Clostridium tertium]|uniref:hypothetical protein n=1 Tax=Clostridium tertium TaxID=1559 RepID=UPI000C06D113|nr:hypothetical protein [Clostridium tertium]
MKLQIIKNTESKQFIVKMIDKGSLICFEYGNSPSEILSKVNRHIEVSINPETIKIWTQFKELILDVPNNEWFI